MENSKWVSVLGFGLQSKVCIPEELVQIQPQQTVTNEPSGVESHSQSSDATPSEDAFTF